MKILLVEDDPIIVDVLREFLSDHLHTVDAAGDGEAAWEQIKQLEYDLIVLDVMLPKLDGIHLCQRLRAHGNSIPILIVTACDTRTDKISGLNAGADDYMVKPIDLEELLARIRALLRRRINSSSPILEWGKLHLNPATYEVSYSGEIVRLTAKEYKVLKLLIQNGRRILSRGSIIEHIGSLDHLPCEESVKAHIKTLRKKLEHVGAPKDLIETVRGMGYRLNQLAQLSVN